ncbi:MAG: site-2 protease family protein [Acidimicrobiaceae bacterium]|nr:site-2 protease family protein [Acidimicrobiaceae bacterium]
MYEWAYFIWLIPSVTLHEVSHGYVANLFGDSTAKDQHRLSLNPLRHVDLFGTILLPGLLIISGLPAFGYAKPVPVNIGRLRNPRKQEIWVALAGPAVNVGLSAVGFGLCEYAIHVSKSYNQLLIFAALGLVNLVLAVFNLVPIPPLDGSAVISRFLPVRSLPSYYRLRQRAMPFLFLFIILDFTFFHVGTNLLPDLENWWLSLLSR